MIEFTVERLCTAQCTEWKIDGQQGGSAILRRAFSGDVHEYEFEILDLDGVKSLAGTLNKYIELADGGEG